MALMPIFRSPYFPAKPINSEIIASPSNDTSPDHNQREPTFEISREHCSENDRNIAFMDTEKDLFMANGDSNDWSKSLHDHRGLGHGSRICLDLSKLEEAGWKVATREVGSKVLLSFTDPEGRKYKSSKDVERNLGSSGTLEMFLKEEEKESLVQKAVFDGDPNSDFDPDPDYEPPLKLKARNEVKHAE